MAENVIRLNGIAATHWNAHQLDQHVIAVFRRTPFDGNVGGRSLAHFFECFVDLLVADLNLVHFDTEVLVIAKVELGEDFEDRAELERLAFLEMNIVHFGTSYRCEFLFVESLLEIFGHQRLNYFALNIFGKAASDNRHRGLARPESGNARNARNVARDFLGGFLNVFSRNFQLDLAFTSGGFGHVSFVARQE
jgi:hypothetical protein